MHNIQVLVKGNVRCSLQMHTDDAKSLDLLDESSEEKFVTVTSRVGSVVVPVEITNDIRPGVVSLPHGWGHDHPGTKMRVAESLSGVNSNVLSDHEAMDPLSGTSVLNGIPVSIARIG
jgi:anaerobic selenocysteine-containing dehydrogenase